jgi:hypothetical protein
MKTKKFIITISVITIGLVGCGSFNHYALPEGAVLLLQNPVQARTTLPEPAPRDTCPMFQLPDIPPIPELPLQELSKIDPRDADAIDAIQQKHIADLRQYVINTNKTITRAYHIYQMTCKMKGVVIG